MEELLFQCPHCETRLDPPEEGWSCTCGACSRRIDLTGQYAYVRGFQAYEEAAEAIDELKAGGSKIIGRYEYLRREQDAYTIFEESYSALQEAFRYPLSPKQLDHGVQMASNLAHLFLPRGMISELEASYWTSLMVEQTARKEHAELLQKIEQRAYGIKDWLLLQRQRLRLRQLVRALEKVDAKIRKIEGGLGLAHPLGAYKGRRF